MSTTRCEETRESAVLDDPFPDPVAYLAQFGIGAELVAWTQDSDLPSAA